MSEPIDMSYATPADIETRLRTYLDAHPDQPDAILRIARTPYANRTLADHQRITNLAERLGDEIPPGDLREHVSALDARISDHRRAFPTTQDEIDRLSTLAVSLSEGSPGPATAHLSTADAAEVARLSALANSVVNGTPPSAPEDATSTASDDAAEIKRLADLAKGLR